MPNRLTDGARRVTWLAAEESNRMGSAEAGPEHLLLALFLEREGVAAKWLAHEGIPLAKLRDAVEAAVAATTDFSAPDLSAPDFSAPMPRLTAHAECVIDLAAMESEQAHRNYVGTEHLLIALFDPAAGIAAQVLGELGLKQDETRAGLIAFVDNHDPLGQPFREDGWLRIGVRGRKLVKSARIEAARLGALQVGTEHLLLAMALQADGAGASVLRKLGVSGPELARELHGRMAPAAGTEPTVPRLGLRARRALDKAAHDSLQGQVKFVEAEQILLALVQQQDVTTLTALAKFGVTPKMVTSLAARFPRLDGAIAPVWDAFDASARRVILAAREEALTRGAAEVTNRHLLLALCGEEDGGAAQVLRNMSIPLARLRREALGAETSGSVTADAGVPEEPKLGIETKTLLENAADEARQLRHFDIGTEHLLLALVRAETGPETGVLHRLGLVEVSVRKRVVEYWGGEDETPESAGALPAEVDRDWIPKARDLERARDRISEPADIDPASPKLLEWLRFSDSAKSTVLLAQGEAVRLGAGTVETEHLLLGLLLEKSAAIASLLRFLHVDVQDLAQAAEAISRAKIDAGPVVREPKLTPECKRTLELAVDFARVRREPACGPECILLGLLRQERSAAAAILGKYAVDESAVLQVLNS